MGNPSRVRDYRDERERERERERDLARFLAHPRVAGPLSLSLLFIEFITNSIFNLVTIPLRPNTGKARDGTSRAH